MSQGETINADATQEADGEAESEHQDGFVFWNYIRDEWKPTVFVAACVTIAHLGFNWLDAIDSYAFMAVGNHVSFAADDAGATTEPAPDSVVVVRIDEQTFRSRYRERTPLDRCVLSSQLGAIYAAQPHVLLIDLDLSPVDWARHESSPEAERERKCQALLKQTLKAGTAEGVRTVLMKPFDTFDTAVGAKSIEWQLQRERDMVCFGDAVLPVSYGVTVDYFTDQRTIYAAATRPTMACDSGALATTSVRDRDRIDVRAYGTKLQPVLTSWTDTPLARTADLADGDLTATLVKVLPEPAVNGMRNRVVFFGAGYGQEDTFLTPVGILYGVEVHAAAYWSREYAGSHLHHFWAFVIDIVIALGFGMIIVSCWTRYFAWRTDDRPGYAQLASLWVAIMLVGLLIAIVLVTALARVLLSRSGVWLSPMPLAIGMLIESCMAGSIAAAVHRLGTIQVRGIARTPAPDSIAKFSTAFKAALWLLALAGVLGLTVFNH